MTGSGAVRCRAAAGPQQVSLTLKADGGKLTGSVIGVELEKSPIAEGTIEDGAEVQDDAAGAWRSRSPSTGAARSRATRSRCRGRPKAERGRRRSSFSSASPDCRSGFSRTSRAGFLAAVAVRAKAAAGPLPSRKRTRCERERFSITNDSTRARLSPRTPDECHPVTRPRLEWTASVPRLWKRGGVSARRRTEYDGPRCHRWESGAVRCSRLRWSRPYAGLGARARWTTRPALPRSTGHPGFSGSSS